MPGVSSMTDVVLLDAGPLGMVSHPRASVDSVEWLASLVASGVRVMIPEIADYEVRRELLRVGRIRASSGWTSSESVSDLCPSRPMRCYARPVSGPSAAARPPDGR